MKQAKWWQRLGNLRVVLLMQVFLPVAMVLAGLLAVALEVVSRFEEERLQRDLQLVARAVRLPVREALRQGDFAQLQSSLASVFEISEVYGAYLFGPQGERLVSFGLVNPVRQEVNLSLELAPEGEYSQYESISGLNVFSFFLPLFDISGRPSGLLQVTRLRSDIEAYLDQLRQRAWSGFAVIVTLLLATLMIAHQRAIGRPLLTLLGSIRKVEAGALSHRAALQGPGEIRQLADGLNRMLDAIQEAQQQARDQRQAKLVAEEKLRLSEKMAALGQLSAGVAHELGAPLSVVDGRARRLLRETDDDTQSAELVSIREQVRRMTALIEQLLDFGRGARKPYPMGVADFFARVMKQCHDEGWQVELSRGQDIHIMADSFSLEQALVNLLRNACQACPDGKVRTGWIIEHDIGRVAFFVDDSGPGIPENIRAQLFEPFFTTKVPGKGSGMGLAIVQRVMREHGGEVKVSRSELGGARFELWLNLRERGDIDEQD